MLPDSNVCPPARGLTRWGWLAASVTAIARALGLITRDAEITAEQMVDGLALRTDDDGGFLPGFETTPQADGSWAAVEASIRFDPGDAHVVQASALHVPEGGLLGIYFKLVPDSSLLSVTPRLGAVELAEGADFAVSLDPVPEWRVMMPDDMALLEPMVPGSAAAGEYFFPAWHRSPAGMVRLFASRYEIVCTVYHHTISFSS